MVNKGKRPGRPESHFLIVTIAAVAGEGGKEKNLRTKNTPKTPVGNKPGRSAVSEQTQGDYAGGDDLSPQKSGTSVGRRAKVRWKRPCSKQRGGGVSEFYGD